MRATPANTDSIIVADVGGTNGRFAIASFAGGTVELSREQTFSNTGLSGFDELLARYLDELGEDVPSGACFATAGPNDGRRGMLTNLGWELDADALESRFGLDDILFVNDFRALARFTPELPESATVAVNEVASAGSEAVSGPISVIGPGTGLGVAIVLRRDDDLITVGTEGGHMAFAPGDELETALRNHLARDYPHVFAELLLSGNGLVRIHDFLADQCGSGRKGMTAAAITEAALAGDPDCERTVLRFLSIMGSIAGDVALCHGALGGVYLGGGIVRRIVPLLASSDFNERFCAKGVMRDYMSGIPVRLITAEKIARRGAARLYEEHRARL
jgi:glucokinase